MQFILNNIVLMAIAAASAVMLIWPMVSRKTTGNKEVGCVETVRLINSQDALVLDVRENQEFAAGHILNAKHIPLGQLEERVGEFEKYKNRPVVLVCRSGARSARAAGILRKNGFGQACNLDGGMIAWEQANMPVEKT